ncbi:MAG: hypothetical protein JXM70_15585, partial [Pirellulales bacterium]|nr:hypothetical protein [Pirellulales bacterium]
NGLRGPKAASMFISSFELVCRNFKLYNRVGGMNPIAYPRMFLVLFWATAVSVKTCHSQVLMMK